MERMEKWLAGLKDRPLLQAALRQYCLDGSLDPAARRKGVGAALLAGALAALKAEGADQCFLEVRAANAPALALYRRLGFASAGVRRGFYRDPPDDAVVMTLTL